MKTYTIEQLQPYVGRRFVLHKTRFSELNGKVGTVIEVAMMPSLPVNELVLIVDVPDCPAMAMMLPFQFASEVKGVK